jgi:hypothetical protein
MEVRPGNGQRDFCTSRTGPRKQAVEYENEDVPFCVSKTCSWLRATFQLIDNRVRYSHHHVESVHFQTPGKKHFHPAVASVQTPAREYFILKDNGMLIGTEEDGVNRLWQTLLGCDEKGHSRDGLAFQPTAY